MLVWSFDNNLYNWAYSRPLLSVTVVPDLVSWVFKKIFSLEMVENGMASV